MGVTDNLLHTESARVVSLVTGGHSEVGLRDLPMENGYHPSQSGPKYKQRRVSAVRDFPPGCGRFAVRLNGRASGNDIVARACLEPESIAPPSNHVDGPELMNVYSERALSTKTDNVTASDHKSSVMEGKSNAVDIVAPKVEMVPQTCLDADSSPDYPDAVPNGNNTEKDVTRNYPPRRRVSAVRDFPPFCGRNAPCLSEEKCRKLHASPNEEMVGLEDKLSKEFVETDVKLMGDNAYDGQASKTKSESDVLAESSCENKEYHVDHHTGATISSSSMDAGVLKENLVRDIVVYEGDKQFDENYSDIFEGINQFQEEYAEALELSSSLAAGQGLTTSLTSPQRQGNGSNTTDLVVDGAGEGKIKKNKKLARKSTFKTRNEADSFGGSLKKKNVSPTRKASQGVGQLVPRGVEGSFGLAQEKQDLVVSRRSQSFNVSLPPSRPSGNGLDNDSIGARNKVRETLRLFQAVCRKLLQEEEAKSPEQNVRRRIDLQASKILKDKGKVVNVGKQIIGLVPGVEVGDEFQYRVELNIVGLHRQTQGGIDYIKHNGNILCTSIVASGGYDDILDNSDILTYTGQGGNVMNGKKEPEDQKLERGNLALVNSLHEKNPVRVIRGESKAADAARTYVYDGLYLVEKYWQDVGTHGKLVFKFRLVRIPGQPELGWKVVKKCKKFKVREGLCDEDISQGKELIPICAVNTIDDEKPPKFNYVTRMMYPGWLHLTPPRGCDCTKKCTDSGNCSCTAKNGGEIPFNHNGAIVETKPLVYECGPQCQCPPSCYNRVSQNGIKFQLEIFKTESRGWGVRSLNSIPSGSFICEYAGELLEEKEAEMRTGNDEYLFDIGNNYSDDSLKDGLSSVMPDSHTNTCDVVEDGGFTIDACQYGNVGRFVNHSCSPNLYAQNVLYDHDDKRMPHIMFFAAENIPPLQELTYHYNYMIDQVRDANGNIKKKDCYCGSSECTGRLY